MKWIDISRTNNRKALTSTTGSSWQIIFLVLCAFSAFRFREPSTALTETLKKIESTTNRDHVLKLNFNSTSPANQSLSIFDRWIANNSKCFYVDDLCHSSARWFYKPRDFSKDDSNKFQPNITLFLNHHDSSKDYYRRAGYPLSLAIEHLAHGVDASRLQCTDSEIKNHFVLFSDSNNMLGEFYDQGILRMWQSFDLYFGIDEGGQETFDEFKKFLREMQLYLHLQDPSPGLLDSHHIFSTLFRSRPLLDLTTLLHEPQCQCLQRVAFCGYEQLESISEETENVGKTKKFFSPVSSPVGKAHYLAYHKLRSFLRKRLVDENPFVQEDIERYRRSILSENNINANSRDWRFIGLTQRSTRRRWTGLDKVIQFLKENLTPFGIIPVEINVEEQSWNAYTQLVRHAAIDGMVGIHGAQLTEAIWMPPGSLVIELLPYVPKEKILGHWTRLVHAPTPLGVIFRETDLNHVGMPLDIESAPYCTFRNVTGCWPVTGHGDMWGERDFKLNTANSNVLLGIVQSVMNLTADKRESALCREFVQGAKDSIVLYNVNCRDSEAEQSRPHHFYWDEESRKPKQK